MLDLSNPGIVLPLASTIEEAIAIKRGVKRDKEILQPCRDSFASYWKTTKPDMAWNWFYDRMAVELQQFYEDVLAGNQPRLMLFAPPRHGKSEGASCRFPSWVFGKSPTMHVIATSYAASLA